MSISDEELIADITEDVTDDVTDDATDDVTDATDDVTDATDVTVTDATDDVTDATDDVTDDSTTQLHKVVVNGKEQEVDLSTLISSFSKSEASQERFDEAAAIKSQTEQTMKEIKNNPIQFLESLGVDMRNVSETYLADKINYDSLSEDQQNVIKLQREIQQIKDQNKQLEEHTSKIEEQKYRDEYINRIETSLEQTGLPVNENTIRRMAYYMSEINQDTTGQYDDVKDEQIAQLVFEDYKSELKSYPEEKLIELLGEDVIKKVKQPVKTVTQPVKQKQGVKEDSTKMNSHEWNLYLDSLQ